MQEVTSGSQWRKLREEGELLELPSGNFARLRPIALIELIHLGHVPNQLLTVAYSLMGGDQDDVSTPEEQVDRLRNFSQLVQIVCKAAFVEPKIVDEPTQDNEITFFDLSEDDRLFVYAWARSPQLSLEKFREQEESVDSV
jgi:hypothetical protein